VIVADTSALIGARRLHYPPALAPSFWTFLDDAIRTGKVVVLDVVFGEIETQSDELHGWLKERSDLITPTSPEAQAIVGELQGKWRFGPGRDYADPFVIAYAKAHDLAVATYEGLSPTGSRARSKKTTDSMPDICSGEGVTCLNPANAWALAGLQL
jgi:predicted nucleic acid-binding protein